MTPSPRRKVPEVVVDPCVCVCVSVRGGGACPQPSGDLRGTQGSPV